MIYPDVTVEEWCERYSLEPTTEPCVKCGQQVTTTRPFATGSWRGLQAEDHGCGVRYLLTIAIDSVGSERQSWANFVIR
jgi:hypothetical protein